MSKQINIIILLSGLLYGIQTGAQPSVSSSFVVNEQKIFRDAVKTNIYYCMPSDYKLAADANGKPEFTLTQMRYTGTQATGDAGKIKYNNLLQFKIVADIQQQKKTEELKTELRKTDAQAELRLLPIRKFSSVLVFAGAPDGAENAGADTARLVKTDYTEAADENASVNNSYWNERVVTLRLSNTDAQLVESAIKNMQSVMSFSYGIYTVFSDAGMEDLSVSGNKEIRKEIKDFFANEIKNSGDSALHITLVKADAIAVKIDLNKWPAAIQKVDINEKIPAKYALFDVYCYDFNNELRPDLYSKKIEIKATSVNGADIVTAFSFRQNKPDMYAKSIRFAYAVKMERPFYYRVTEINNDGETWAGEWIKKKEWNEILDITSSPDKVVPKKKEETDQ
jgi:hypothetical protein